MNQFTMRAFIKHGLMTLVLLASALNVHAKTPLQVAVVNYPLEYFAQRIGGDHVEVLFLAPGDTDPAFWHPDAEAISRYQQADLILLNGAAYAKWVKKVSLPRARMINTGKAYRDRLIHVQGPSHNHGPEGEHAHAGTAFTTWLDFQLAMQQVDAVTKALSRKLPAHADQFTANASALTADLEQLDKAMMALGQQLQESPLVASHPVYQYMARRYGLNVTELLWEPEMELEQRDLAGLQNALKDKPARWMIWEGQPSEENAAALAKLGINSLVFQPLGNRPEQGNWLAAMKANIEQLKRALDH
jgi:zinc transport system substrate-binding protein